MKAFIFIVLLTLSLFSSSSHQFTNALIDEESPYLLQHAHNPVNWFAWDKEAFQIAKEEKKLIFVSIGYSTCHWCHVMEEESFENKKIAQQLNQSYISIKVDKEEMPHLDTAFQEIHSKLKQRRNGWPLNFIITPEKKLIYITTYIPATFKYGVEGMETLIPRIAKQYKEKNKKLFAQMSAYETILRQKEKEELRKKSTTNLSKQFVNKMTQRQDKVYKGFDKAPKFPLASHLNLLLDIYTLEQNEEALHMVNDALIAMADGGIYDQVEGAFYRYSTLSDWIIPHFEKMLYTQAELIPVYYKAYKITKNPLFLKIIHETISQTNKKFRTKNGLYYSASDADSMTLNGKKEEGYYFTYTYTEAKEAFLLNKIVNSDELLEYLGFDDFGNFENELNNPYILDEEKAKPKNYQLALKILKTLRHKKEFPFIDKKVITSWNALMIKSLFIASRIDKKYLFQAQKSLKTLLEVMYKKKQLYHQKFDKNKAYQIALLEDYSFLTDTLLTAYQTTYNKDYFTMAQHFNQFVEQTFYKNKQWYLDPQQNYPVNFKDKYYTAPISRFFHNCLTIANLNYDLKKLHQSKQFITEQTNRILTHLDSNPEAIRAILRKEAGDVILKSNPNNLLKNQQAIETITYPFVLTQKEDTNQYLACDESTCFAYDLDIEKVIQAINK